MDGGFDLFNWANRAEEWSKSASLELFFFNKNYTPYKVRLAHELETGVRRLFLEDLVAFVNKGAENDLSVQRLDKQTNDKAVLVMDIEEVDRAATLINLIEKEYADIIYFSGDEHDFRRIKGVAAKFTYGDGGSSKNCYVIKSLSGAQALSDKGSWELRGEKLEPFSASVGIRVPEGNEVLVVDDGKNGWQLVALNRSKFERLFQFDVAMTALAPVKADELAKAYEIALAEGLDLAEMLKEKKALVKKLDEADLDAVSQAKLMEFADEMQLPLMLSENGKIIIADDRDLAMLVNLIDENYFVSATTGKRYEIKSKKLLDDEGAEKAQT
ncbi:hypothetical protein FWG76_02150 [Candidatus Saccharibacteria bacterium]|nr:hypothetical protein [Candidatus Saccharibacteria bacterium]